MGKKRSPVEKLMQDGGRHLYFTRPDFSVSNGKIAEKIDVRCDAGYVILPPSVHPSGRVYQWLGTIAEIRELPPNVLEKQEQHECWKIFKAHGCEVYTLSQARATKQTEGLGDMYVLCPRVRVAFWFEAKRSVGGVQSGAQAKFQSLNEQCGVRYVLGDRSAAWDVLHKIGVIDE